MIEKDFEYKKLCRALERNKNVIVCAGAASGKSFLVNKYLTENKDKYKKVFVSCFDREKYLLYGKSVNLTIDCILKKALVSSFSLHEGIYLSADCHTDFESRLCEDTLLVVENYDIAAPSPYMRHLAKLSCKMIVVSRCQMENCGEEFERVVLKDNECYSNIKERIVTLSEKQSELLRTLSAMLYYLRDDTVIKSSKTGVFDINSVRFYLSSLCDELYHLSKEGLVHVHENGRISIERSVCEWVINNLSPSLNNCPTFMNFCEKYCDFLINPSAKSDFGIIKADKKDTETFATRELLEVYTHFSLTDENATLRIYNLLISYLLSSSYRDGVNDSAEHLFLRNKDYMLCLLEKELSKAQSFEFLLSDESSMESDLDIVRLCVCSLRNMPFTLYKENETIIDVFTSVLEGLYKKISGLDDNEADKKELLSDVISICYETFSFGCAITSEAKYIDFRDGFFNHRICYNSQMESDRQNAVSLFMGYSPKTIKLYGVFQRLLDAYIDEAEKSNNRNVSTIVEKLQKQRLADFSEITKNISVHFCRIKNGYDKFYGFLEEKYEKEKIYNADLDEGIEKKLEDNRHYLVRGFDKATKTGAKKYADEIINTLKTASDPFPYLRLVFDTAFPINDEVYKYLSLCGLSDIVSNNERMPNMTKQILLEYLVDIVFVGCRKKEHTKLCLDCIGKLLESVNQTEASRKRLSNIASAMYLENIFYCMEYDLPYKTVEELYIKCSDNSDITLDTSDEYFAKVLYSKLCGKGIKYSKEKLLSAMRCIILEYMTEKNDFSRKGFVKACLVVADKKKAREIFDMLVSHDFSKTLSSNTCHEISHLFD